MSGFQVGDPRRIAAARKKGQLQDNVSGGKTWIFVVSGFTLLQSLLTFWQSGNYDSEVATIIRIFAGGYAALAVIYFFLGLWANKAPVGAAVIALLLYLGVQAFYFMLEPSLVLRGIIWKAFVVAALCKAIQSGRALARA